MEQYIPKSPLVAEIKDRICSYQEYIDSGYNYEDRKQELEDLLLSIDTLEVKEVDLEKEYEEFVVDDPIFGHFITNDTMGMELAKHFFELGMQVSNKAQKCK